MEFINYKTKSLYRLDDNYVRLCHEAFIDPRDAKKKGLTEEELMAFIYKDEDSIIREESW
jgi:hypothetical protein